MGDGHLRFDVGWAGWHFGPKFVVIFWVRFGVVGWSFEGIRGCFYRSLLLHPYGTVGLWVFRGWGWLSPVPFRVLRSVGCVCIHSFLMRLGILLCGR